MRMKRKPTPAAAKRHIGMLDFTLNGERVFSNRLVELDDETVPEKALSPAQSIAPLKKVEQMAEGNTAWAPVGCPTRAGEMIRRFSAN